MVSFVLNLASKGDFVLQAYIIDCQVEIQLFYLLPLTIENICKTLGAVLKSDLFFMSEQHHSTANSLYE
jgi:hypothetical protein